MLPSSTCTTFSSPTTSGGALLFSRVSIRQLPTTSRITTKIPIPMQKIWPLVMPVAEDEEAIAEDEAGGEVNEEAESVMVLVGSALVDEPVSVLEAVLEETGDDAVTVMAAGTFLTSPRKVSTLFGSAKA